MAGGCGCPECRHPACPPVDAVPPYDEVSHEVENNILSIRVSKNVGKIQREASSSSSPDSLNSPIDLTCTDAQGQKCRRGCTKVNVISNQLPPPKLPEEEMLLLRSIRQLLPNDDLKNTLEIEFKASRNYKPLPEPGPRPRIIIPQVNFSRKGRKGKQKDEDPCKEKKKRC